MNLLGKLLFGTIAVIIVKGVAEIWWDEAIKESRWNRRQDKLDMWRSRRRERGC